MLHHRCQRMLLKVMLLLVHLQLIHGLLVLIHGSHKCAFEVGFGFDPQVIVVFQIATLLKEWRQLDFMISFCHSQLLLESILLQVFLEVMLLLIPQQLFPRLIARFQACQQKLPFDVGQQKFVMMLMHHHCCLRLLPEFRLLIIKFEVNEKTLTTAKYT